MTYLNLPDPEIAELLYETAAEMGLDETLTEEDADRVRVRAGLTGKAWKKYTGAAGRRKIQRWLADPATYSPFIDPIAIERARNYDWAVYERLSGRELSHLYDLLADEVDPYCEDATPGEEMKARRQAWERGPEVYKERVAHAVANRRRDRAREAA